MSVLGHRCSRLVEGSALTARAQRPENLHRSPELSTQSSSQSSPHPSPQPQASRRARRAAERRAAPPARRQGQPRTARSPILLITAIVGGLGVVLLGALVLLQSGPAKADTSSLLSPSAPTPVALADGRSIGKADARVTLDVWSDFQCPACGEFARSVEPLLVGRYVTPGTLRIVYHDAAFQGAKSSASYDESVEAAAGARCAADQGRYWPFQDWTFANQAGENKGAFAIGRLKAIATAAGLDLAAWDACLATGQQQTAVRSETTQAVARGVSATPTMILNGQTIVGLHSVTELGGLIEAAAAAAGG
jgi:protein-disulfide isomerase